MNDNSYFNFAADLARAQAGYESKSEPIKDILDCVECGEQELPLHIGRIGCDSDCYQDTEESLNFCKRFHRCSTCIRRVSSEYRDGRY